MSLLGENFLLEMSKKIDGQELRVYQRDVQELRSQFEKARKCELEANQMLGIEKARNKTQEREIERRRKQLEESTDLIKRLQTDLEDARQTANGVKWELRENEIKSITEAEIIHYRAQVSGLEAKLKRKQVELQLAHELIKNSQESMEKEIKDLKLALRTKEKALEGYVAELNKLNLKAKTEDREQVDALHERIGALTATNDTLQDRIDALQAEKLELENKLRYADEDRSSLRNRIDSLKDELTDTEGTNQQTSSYLNDEIDKIKHQKAQLRCEQLKLKKDYTRLEAEHKSLKENLAKSNSDAKIKALEETISGLKRDKEGFEMESGELRRKLRTVEVSASEYQRKLADCERVIHENEDCEKARTQQLSAELENSRKKMDSMRKALLELDSQCDKLMNKLKGVDQDKKDVQVENKALQKEIEDIRKQLESHRKMENNAAALHEENLRLISKIGYLENELKESHTEHRNELTNLAKQLAVSRQKETLPQSPATGMFTMNQLETRLRQQESQNKYLERQIEQIKKESTSTNKELADTRKRQCDLINENTSLRQGLDAAIRKAEQYRNQNVELNKTVELLQNDVEANAEKLLNFEDKISELKSELDQKEKLANYLQSVVQPKQMQKLSRKVSSHTLISTGSEAMSNIEMESQQCEQLEQCRDDLRNKLEHQRKVLSEKQNELVPLLKNRDLDVGGQTRAIKRNRGNVPSPLGSPLPPGRMSHEIPHRWKKQFISLNISSTNCVVCYEGLPHFGHVFKCRECSLMVHSRCKPNIVNTCGLPTECANLYLGPYSISTDTMTGWVKLWRSDDTSGNKWRNAWSVIDDHKLSFYDTDNLALNNGSPFAVIDLDNERWKIFNQVGQPMDGLTGENMSMVIEIKLPTFTLFMLAPTVQAKQRWVRALQYATNRRMFVQRRPSSSAVYTMLLALEKPQNLGINCTQVLDGEWLLLGCQEGLFATSINNPKAPFNLAGMPTIYFMEIVVEHGHEMILAICGSARQLVVVHLQQVRRALKADAQPSVQYTPISNIDNCHIAVVSKPEHYHKRYVYLATADAIHILQFVQKLGVFSPVKQIKTEEPCMCICSTSTGFMFGADSFHIARFEDFACVPLQIDNCPSDFPVSIIEISLGEYLLAFNNYGVFVSAQGKRSRLENVQWERLPIEFVYSAPYLYIVYCDFLEIARVAPNEGLESEILTEDRSMFKCRSAHRTGFGNKPSDVLFSVSTEDRVELHVFNSSDVESTVNFRY